MRLKREDTMSNFTLARRDFLTIVGTMLATSTFSMSLRAEGMAAEIKFGYPNASWGTIGMIGEANDLFKKAGANIKTFTFDSGKSTRDAMISERVEIGVIGATPFVIGAAKGQMEAIALALYGAKTLAVVGGVKAGIKSVKDLKGRRIGSQFGSSTDFVLRNKILPKYGLKQDDVKIINTRLKDQPSALAAGSIDAFAGAEPFVSVAEVEKLGRVLVDYSDFDLAPVILAANKSAVAHKRDAVVAFLRGWLASVKAFHDAPDQAAKIVFKHFKDQGFSVNEVVVKRMLSKFDVRPALTPAVQTYLEAQSKALLRQKKIAALPDWNKLLNRELLATAGAKA
jgi:ABC-type nitrate/sulfonate/bicarbonate transport system substrate-binding protein